MLFSSVASVDVKNKICVRNEGGSAEVQDPHKARGTFHNRENVSLGFHILSRLFIKIEPTVPEKKMF